MSIKALTDQLNQHQVGSKAYSLSQLNLAGIKVPAGFVLDKDVHKQLIHNKNPMNKLKGLTKDYLKRFSSSFLMVRSSAIGEDGDDESYAGQLDSYQVKNNVEDVCQAIIKCWNSLENTRLKEYSEHKGKKLNEIAVIVQEMIEPEYAGVLFTLSPIDQEGVYIEFVKGHAEKLVQGEITPESLIIKSEQDTYEAPFEVNDLLNQKEKILKFFKGVHQDIEWAYRNKTFYFVQSRPITTIKEKIKWSNTNVNENYPEKISPLLYSIAKQSYYHYYKNLALKLGVLKVNDASSESEFSNAIGLFGHRMYYNMSSIHNIIAHSPLSGLLKQSFDDFVGYQKKNQINKSKPSLFKLISIFSRVAYHYLNLSQKVILMEKRIEKYAQKRNNENKISIQKINQNFHHFLFIRFHLWHNASFADFYSMLFHGLLGKYLYKLKLENASQLHNALIQAIPNLISNRPIHRMWKLHLNIKNDKKLNQVFRNQKDDILDIIKNLSNSHPFKKAFEAYLNDWGYRCPGELTFLMPNYREAPENFIQVLKTYHLSQPENPQKQFDYKHAEQINLQYKTKIEIRQRYKKNPLKKFFAPLILKFLIKSTIFSISCRERVRLKQAQLYAHFKWSMLQAGKLFKAENILQDSNDIFYLEYPEINRLLSSEEMSKQYLQKLISLRKENLKDAVEKPDNLYTFREDIPREIFIQADQQSNLPKGSYQGLAACSGIKEGHAVVVEDISKIDKIKKGDILITKQTDPGWICVFPMISAIVVERGGVLSHSAIVAREFGIPAVVGIDQITTYIKDGDRIKVNGNTGIIECLQ